MNDEPQSKIETPVDAAPPGLTRPQHPKHAMAGTNSAVRYIVMGLIAAIGIGFVVNMKSNAKRVDAEQAAAKAVVSIDTTSPEVAAACLDAGASAVNDVSCLRDRDLARVASGSRAALVISHGRAPQETMKGFGGISERSG